VNRKFSIVSFLENYEKWNRSYIEGESSLNQGFFFLSSLAWIRNNINRVFATAQKKLGDSLETFEFCRYNDQKNGLYRLSPPSALATEPEWTPS
jgi:hypothetical protein